MVTSYIAHRREDDGKEQPLIEHLNETAQYEKTF